MELVDPPPADALGKGPLKKKASIAGTVIEGDRIQPGLTVELFKVGVPGALASVTVNAAGAYLFKDLDPGTYRVVTAKSASRTRGEKRVILKEEEAKVDVEIKLYR